MTPQPQYARKPKGPAERPTEDAASKFKQDFPKRFFVRFHMMVLLSGVCLSGLLVSKLLLGLGMRSMLARYLIAVCASYAVFFVLIRVWLWYISDSKESDRSLPDVDIVDSIDIGQMSADALGRGTGGVSEVVNGPLSEGSGDFGGGGATDMWDDKSGVLGLNLTRSVPDASSASASHRVSSSSSGGGWGFDLDGDEAIVLIALAVLLVVIFGAGAYLVYAAPEILSEAAFEALLAAGLIKASKKMTRQGWMGSVLRATCIPFIVVLIMTVIFGLVVSKYCPRATRLSDVFTGCSSEKQ